MAKVDLAWEALVEVTGAVPSASRGELNIALKTMREATGLDGEELAQEIRYRAKLYRDQEIGPILTPTALMVHWERVITEKRERERRDDRGTNAHVHVDCATCQGDRWVVYALRPAEPTRFTPNVEGHFEEMAPCPDCNAEVFEWRRANGQRMRTPDPGAVRLRLGQ